MAKKKCNTIVKKKVIKDSKSDKVSSCMTKFKDGQLKDRHGNIVTDKDQALAIALNEAGLSRKTLEKAEVLNKIKVYKSQIKKMIQKQDAKEEALFDKIIQFFQENPNPDDSKVHDFAEKNNIDTHKLESVIYMILSDFLSGGASKGVNNNYDENEIKLGMIVEAEHSSIPALQRKIVYDHLAENPAYYSDGRDKGVFIELENSKVEKLKK